MFGSDSENRELEMGWGEVSLWMLSSVSGLGMVRTGYFERSVVSGLEVRN